MAEANGQEPVVTQPAPQPEPSYKKYSEQTGTEEWQNDLFDCFEGPDHLCTSLPPSSINLANQFLRSQGNILLLLRLRQDQGSTPRPNLGRL